MQLQTLRDHLNDWTDSDIAAFYLAQSIGLMSPEVNFAVEAKHVFWSHHPVGITLSDMLRELAALGVLQYRDEPDYQYRWNPAFVGSWEVPWKPEAP